MRNLFKKALAFCLVAALALTCFAGTFYAAEPYTATISVDSKTITLGTETVDVVLNISSPAAGINEALFKVSSDLGTVTAVDVAEDDIAIIDYATNDGETVSDYGSFYLSAKNTSDGENGTVLGSINAATITVTFAVAAGVGEYPINIETSGVKAASKDEDVITLSYATANVIVEEEATECEHVNTEFYYDDEHEIVAAQGELQGSTSVETAKGRIFFKCIDCGEIIEEEVNYYYYYTTGTQNAALESEILYNFKAQPKHLNMQGTFQDAYFVLDMEKETGLVRKVTNYVDADYEDGAKPYYVVSMGVAAKEMTTAMVSTVFVKYNDQWWSGYQFNKKFVDYATERFNASNSTDEEKTMFADMLTYGAAAQNYYDFNLDDLATEYLGSFSSYVTVADPVIEDKTVNGLLDGLDHVGYNAYSLELGSIVTIKLGFRTDFYKGTEELGELSAVCTYTDNSGNPQSKTYTSAEYTPVAGKSQRWEFSYDGIAAKDMRKIVTCTINNASGQVGYSLETSIESVACLLKAQTSNNELKTTIDAMIKYGDSANAYFTK